MKKSLVIVFLWGIIVLGSETKMNSPQEFELNNIKDKKSNINYKTSIIEPYFRFYSNIISPIDGDNRCSFYPTCSQYSKNVIIKHGLILGLLMTTDRLQRCGFDEGKIVIYKNHFKIYDPAFKNDFWFKD